MTLHHHLTEHYPDRDLDLCPTVNGFAPIHISGADPEGMYILQALDYYLKLNGYLRQTALSNANDPVRKRLSESLDAKIKLDHALAAAGVFVEPTTELGECRIAHTESE